MSETFSPETTTLEQVAAELLRLRERVEDLEDLRDLNSAIDRNEGKSGVAWKKICQEYGWTFDESSPDAGQQPNLEKGD